MNPCFFCSTSTLLYDEPSGADCLTASVGKKAHLQKTNGMTTEHQNQQPPWIKTFIRIEREKNIFILWFLDAAAKLFQEPAKTQLGQLKIRTVQPFRLLIIQLRQTENILRTYFGAKKSSIFWGLTEITPTKSGHQEKIWKVSSLTKIWSLKF